MFFVTPAIYGVYAAFTKWDLFNEPVFIGLENFKTLILEDDLFLTAVQNTLVYAIIYGPTSFLLAFVREFEGERILCTFNAGEEAVRFVPGLGGEVEPLLGRIHLEQGEDGLVIIVPAHSGVALSLEKTVPLDWDSHWDVENATAD